jgi:hypothetical protein
VNPEPLTAQGYSNEAIVEFRKESAKCPQLITQESENLCDGGAVCPEELLIPIRTNPDEQSRSPQWQSVSSYFYLMSIGNGALRSFEIAEPFLLLGAQKFVNFGLHASIRDDQSCQ